MNYAHQELDGLFRMPLASHQSSGVTILHHSGSFVARPDRDTALSRARHALTSHLFGSGSSGLGSQ
jgi:hypothetical protein